MDFGRNEDELAKVFDYNREKAAPLLILKTIEKICIMLIYNA